MVFFSTALERCDSKKLKMVTTVLKVRQIRIHVLFVSLFKAQVLKILSVIYRLVLGNSYATKRLFDFNCHYK